MSETFIRNPLHIFPHQSRLQTLDCSFSLVHAEGHAEFRVESSIKEVQASYDWPNNTYKKHWVDHLKSHVQCPRWFSGCFCSAYVALEDKPESTYDLNEERTEEPTLRPRQVCTFIDF